MTEGQRQLRKLRWHERLAFVCALALAFALVWSVSALFHVALSPLPLFLLSLPVGVVLYFAYLLRGFVRARPEVARDSSTFEVVTLSRFLAEPDPVIAPNFPEVALALRQWLIAFTERHGPTSVYVERDRDEPQHAHLVLLRLPKLEATDRQALLRFHADGIHALRRTESQRRFPALAPHERVFTVVWD